MAAVVLPAVSAVGVLAAEAGAGGGAVTAHGLMVHHLHGPGVLHPVVQGSLGAHELGAILDATPNLVDAQTWLGRAQAGALTDEVVACFDDGLACQYDLALPVLQARNLTACWFVYTQQPNRLEVDRWTRTVTYPDLALYYAAFFPRAHAIVPLSTARGLAQQYLTAHTYLSDEDRLFRWYRDCGLTLEQYRLIADEVWRAATDRPLQDYQRLWMPPAHWQALQASGHIIGLHSHTHPTSLRGVDWAAEYATNVQRLVAILPSWRPQVVAHPCNLSTELGDAVLRGLGVTVGFDATMTSRVPGDPLHYPREDSADARKRVCAS